MRRAKLGSTEEPLSKEDRAMPYANIVIPVWDHSVPVKRGELPHARETNGVRLQWSKGETGHVQLVTTVFKPGSAQWMPEQDDLDIALWTSLDRRTINQLIQHLRQARDDAFGKDA